MKQLTIVATIPPHTDAATLRKIHMIKAFLQEEIGVKANLVVIDGEGKPRIIAMDEVIDLNEDLNTIIHKIAESMAYDLSDPNFLDKVAIGVSGKE